MTKNQIAMFVAVEGARHNKATEVETNRHNLVDESVANFNASTNWYNAETNRYNADTNRYNAETNRLNYHETVRHNQATESLGWANLDLGWANHGETVRHNKAQESIGWGNIALGYSNVDLGYAKLAFDKDKLSWTKYVDQTNLDQSQQKVNYMGIDTAGNYWRNYTQGNLNQEKTNTESYVQENYTHQWDLWTEQDKLWNSQQYLNYMRGTKEGVGAVKEGIGMFVPGFK